MWDIVKAVCLHAIRCRSGKFRITGIQETLCPYYSYFLITCLKCKSTFGIKMKKERIL